MKLTLNKKELFWSLIDPMDIERVLVILNESSPEVEIDYDKMPDWAKGQIAAAAKRGKLSTDPEVTKEVSSTEGNAKKTTKKASKKKVAKHVS